MFEKYKINKLVSEIASSPDKEHKSVIASLREYGQQGLDALVEQYRISRILHEDMKNHLRVYYDKRSLAQFIHLLGDANEGLRTLAGDIILDKGGASVLPQLVEHLGDGNTYQRRGLTHLITRIGNSSTLDKIIPLLHDDDREIKKTAIAIMGEIGGTSATMHIASLIGVDDWWVRKKAVEALAKIKDPQSLDSLLAQLDREKDPKIKSDIISTLGDIGDAETARRILPHINNEDLVLRQQVVDAVERTADASIVSDVIAIMKDAEVNTRRAAVEILDKVRDPNAVHMLLKALQDSDWWVREIATDALVELRSGGLNKKVIELFKSEEENVRRSAVEYFVRSPDPAALDGLIGLLKDRDWWVREKCVQALGKLGDEKAIEPILELAEDPDVRVAVPAAFGDIGGGKAVMYLHDFMEDPDRSFRLASLKALGLIKSKVSLPHIKNMVKDEDDAIRNRALAIIKDMTGRAVRAEQIIAEQERERSTGGSTVLSAVVPEDTKMMVEAILVIDLASSTEIGSTYGDSFAMKISDRLTELVKPISAKHRVRFTKSTGDGYLMTFPQVKNAIDFSLDVLDVVKEDNEKVSEGERIKLRFAVNVGETRIDAKGDRLGTAVNMTFRVDGLKSESLIPDEGGIKKEEMPLVNRILITEPVHKEATAHNDFKTRYIGFFDMKGISGRHKIFQLIGR